MNSELASRVKGFYFANIHIYKKDDVSWKSVFTFKL